VQGTSHQRNGVPCQDAHGYRVLPGGAVIIGVADGAGSARRSDAGSQCVVGQAIDSLETALSRGAPYSELGWQSLLMEAFRQARQAIENLARGEDAPLRAFDTTLTCAVAFARGLVVGQIGDCLAVARGEDGQLFTATQPQRGEYANETFFLTGDDALEHLDVHVHPATKELAVMSDGLIRLAINVTENAPHAPFFQPLLSFAAGAEDEAAAGEQLAGFLASDRVCARTDDDKTLVLAVRR
jgi:hypothetical protein